MAPPFFVAIILHEIAHGYVAFKLGDPTAKQLGRITLNPLKHIDLFMSILLPGFLIISGSPVIFGGAKAIPVNPGYFKNPRRGMAIVAAAGPITNLILAFIAFEIHTYLAQLHSNSYLLGLIQIWMVFSVLVNVVLALFNLIPVPPLDGGRIAVGLLPLSLAKPWAKLERFGLLIVFLMLMYNIPDMILGPAIDFVTKEIANTVPNIEQPIEPNQGDHKQRDPNPIPLNKESRSDQLELTLLRQLNSIS